MVRDRLLLLLFFSGTQSKIICDRPWWGQHPSGNWVLPQVRWKEKWWWGHPHRNGGCVHLPILDIQSWGVPASPLPGHIADMWPVQAGLGFSLFCCGTMPTGVCPPVWRRESRVLCKGVKSFSWSLFTYVAWGTAGLAILLHLRAQWWQMTVLTVLKSTGAADCGNVEASFAILSARMFPSIPLKRNLCVTTCCYLLNQWKYVVHNFFLSSDLCKLLDSRPGVTIQIDVSLLGY